MRGTKSHPPNDIQTCMPTVATLTTSPPVKNKPSQHTTPPYANGACGPNNVTKHFKPSCLTMPCSSNQHSHEQNPRHNRNHVLKYKKHPKTSAQRSPTPLMGGGAPSGPKRDKATTPMAHGSQPPTISRLRDLMATCTDEHNIHTLYITSRKVGKLRMPRGTL